MGEYLELLINSFKLGSNSSLCDFGVIFLTVSSLGSEEERKSKCYSGEVR